MQYSSDTEASIVFQKYLYKQLFFDLFNQCKFNALIERFYRFQIDLFKNYSSNLDKQKYSKVFSFDKIDNHIKMELLESVFYHLIGTLKTLPIQYWGEKVDLIELIDQHDVELIQNGLIGSRPKALDYFSPEFLKRSHKEFCQSEYQDFLLFIINKRIINTRDVDTTSFIVASLSDLLETYPEEKGNVAICPHLIDDSTNMKGIVHYRQLTDLYLKLLEGDKNSNIQNAKHFINDWGIEAGITSLLNQVAMKTETERTVDVGNEFFNYFSNHSDINLSNFINHLINSRQQMKVYVPVVLPRADHWKIPQHFKIKFILLEDLINEESEIPNNIIKEIEYEKNRFSHLMIFNTVSKNSDYQYVLNEVNEKWDAFLDLLHLHEDKPMAYRANFDMAFVHSISDTNLSNKWWSAGYSAKYRPLLDDNEYKQKEEFFKNINYPIINSNNDLAKRVITSYTLYREALGLAINHPKFAFGSMWLCLEMISGSFNPKEVANRLAFIPALFTDDINTKEYFKKITNEDIKNLYFKRKIIFETIIEELGELRNKLVFHKTDPHTFQSWRLEKHIQLLQLIVKQVQILTANTIAKSPEIKNVKEIKKLKESHITSSKRVNSN